MSGNLNLYRYEVEQDIIIYSVIEVTVIIMSDTAVNLHSIARDNLND